MSFVRVVVVKNISIVMGVDKELMYCFVRTPQAPRLKWGTPSLPGVAYEAQVMAIDNLFLVY